LGFSVYDFKKKKVLKTKTIKTPDTTFQEQLAVIMEEIEGIIDNYNIDFLVYERVYSRRKISLVAGVIIGTAISNHIDYSSSSPAHMKKVITGNGRCGKELIAKKLAELYNINVLK
jgi:Holliday junction resolvasome RuvABC endonuclease subunit